MLTTVSKELFRNPEKPDHDGRREWFRNREPNGDDLNPWKWSIEETNKDLKRLYF
jgi:hypothetical protein